MRYGRMWSMATRRPTAAKNQFSSQESSFPVFDASVKDLQALKPTLSKHVTAFYTS